MTIENGVIRAYTTAKKNGFHEEDENTPTRILSMLALIHSELGEATEAIRKNRRCDISKSSIWDSLDKDEFNRKFEEEIKDTFEDEIADTIIRIFDLCGALKIDLNAHVEGKMEYNVFRPYKHGKII